MKCPTSYRFGWSVLGKTTNNWPAIWAGREKKR